MIKTSKKQRNSIIASIIIVALAISSIMALAILYQPSTAKQAQTKLYLKVSTNQTNVLQGNSLQAQVNVTTIGKAQNITLSSDVGSSGINCSLAPPIGVSNFTSLLTINVPDFTSTANYSVVVKATTESNLAQNTSYVISVLSANVTMSGRVILNSAFPLANLYSIHFQDIQTNVTYTGTFPSPYPFNADQNIYSIELQNEHTYKVTVDFSQGNDEIQFPDSFNAGNFYVFAPAGNSTVPGQNFYRSNG